MQIQVGPWTFKYQKIDGNICHFRAYDPHTDTFLHLRRIWSHKHRKMRSLHVTATKRGKSDRRINLPKNCDAEQLQIAIDRLLNY